MITKTIEILDSMTFIPALAIKLQPASEADRRLIARAGYGVHPDDQAGRVLLLNLNDCEAANDPYHWGSARTMRAAHAFLEEHFDEIESGDVVDVEFILGETTEPKQSEARL